MVEFDTLLAVTQAEIKIGVSQPQVLRDGLKSQLRAGPGISAMPLGGTIACPDCLSKSCALISEADIMTRQVQVTAEDDG